MSENLREKIINRLRAPLEEYNASFRNLLETGRDIENSLQHGTEMLSEIRHRFDNLSATVELEFEGAAVFDQEIKRMKELLEQTITKVDESLKISNRISEDLQMIAQTFDQIHKEGVQLDDIIKDINTVSESIEVASRNAGITAFHAGKKGRGFEVIAREMTNLVRSSRIPTNLIPVVSKKVIREVVSLGHDLLGVSKFVFELKHINKEFSGITDELLELIPGVEANIKSISDSVTEQKALHNHLLEENQKLSRRIDEIYDTARFSAVLELSLGTVFRHINNIRKALLEVQNNSNFIHIYNSLKIALSNTRKSYDKGIETTIIQNISKIGRQFSERPILQFVSEANHLYKITKDVAHEVKNWLNTNTLGAEVLSRGTKFYKNIMEILISLNKKINALKTMVYEIDPPLTNLKKIMERSRILGLYAGIESARGGEYAGSLGVVTKEIKGLSQKTSEFVSQIIELKNEMLKNFQMLSDLLVRSISDVEQGICFLNSAVDSFNENKKLMENLNTLTNEMVESTSQMIEQCNELGAQFRNLKEEYGKIEKNFPQYFNAVDTSAQTSEKILDMLNHYEKDVTILKKEYKTIVFRDSIEPITLDPAIKTDARSHEVIEQIFTGLLTFDSANNLIPAIADNFTVSKDGRQWDFTLKKNVKFHNGQPLTAKNVMDTIRRVRKGPNLNFIDYINEMIVLDDYRIRFILEYPYLPFLANLACGVCDITPDNFNPEAPVGAGPYRFIEWNKGKEIVLEVFNDFFDGRPPIDQIIVKFIEDDNEAVELFHQGKIDIMQITSDMIKKFSEDELVSGPVLSTQYLGINVQPDTPFKDKRVRQALNYALDREYYCRVILEGQAVPARGVFPPGLSSYNPEIKGYSYNLDRARELMREAGFANGLDQEYAIDVRDSKTSVHRAEYLRDCFKKIGIKIVVNPMPWKEFLERGYEGKSLLCTKSWISDNGDPDNFLFPLFHSRSFGSPGNTSFYKNSKVDEMIEKARSEPNVKQRIRLYQQAEEIIVDDAPWVFISHGVDSYAVNKKIGGFRVDPFGIIRFRNLWVE